MYIDLFLWPKKTRDGITWAKYVIPDYKDLFTASDVQTN